MIGKNKMTDWRACIRTWENKNHNNKPKNKAEESIENARKYIESLN
jgi:hypothetical protein